MTTTTNKALSLPLVGGESGTWGTDVNNNVITPLDLMLGGVASVALSSTDYTIGTNSASEVQDVMVKLTGTLLANVTVFSANIGFYFVENNTTGNFTVTWWANFGSGNVGFSKVIPQGQRILLVSDTSAGVRRGDTSSIPTGTVTDFFQAAAPVGWTQNVSFSDYAMRIVSGTGGGNAGSQGFSATLSSGTVGGTAITTSQMPVHSHTVTDPGHLHDVFNLSAGPIGTGFSGYTNTSGSKNLPTTTNTTGITATDNAGSGTTHTHTMGFSVNMLDLILCTKG